MAQSSGVSPPREEGEDDPRPLVLVLNSLRPYEDAALSPRFRLLVPCDSPELTREGFLSERCSRVRAVISTRRAHVDARMIACLPCLGCVVTSSAGFDHIDLDACRRRGISVANAGGVFSEVVAEYAVGLLLDVLRRISAANRYVRTGMWRAKGDYPLGHKLSGRRVGIIGLGSIGSLIAKLLGGFRCKVSYCSRTEKPSVPYQYFSTALGLATENDILILSCSLTSETQHIVGRDVLEALGKDGVVINIGRGALIDEKELVRCLREGVIGGAGLDVFEDQPRVPPELFEMDNVVLSPHASVFTEDALTNVMKATVENLDAFFSGKPLLYPVPL